MSDPVIEAKIILEQHLSSALEPHFQIFKISKIKGGYSNQTYSLTTNMGNLILRKPPTSVNIKSGHDVSREYVIMNALAETNITVPNTVYFEPNADILGTPFYLMQEVKGVVLRSEMIEELNPGEDVFYNLSRHSINQLIELHSLKLDSLDLGNLGRPSGYIGRQVNGWIMRYEHAKTDPIKAMETISQWLKENGEYADQAALIHNDYKYDNLLLNRNDLSQIEAVLDWEMATVGHPLMDLGTTLAYWVEDSDEATLKVFNTTWLPGNMSRKEVVDYYASQINFNVPNMLFFIVFGFYKIAVIAQQIYYRYCLGKAKDPRFGMLGHVVRAAAKKGLFYINKGEI